MNIYPIDQGAILEHSALIVIINSISFLVTLSGLSKVHFLDNRSSTFSLECVDFWGVRLITHNLPEIYNKIYAFLVGSITCLGNLLLKK